MASETKPIFDSLLKELGEFGPYQIKAILLLLIPATFFNAWPDYNYVFFSYKPDKQCQQWNVKFELIETNFGNVSDQCEYEGKEIPGSGNLSVHCENWTFDKRYFDQTIATQWGFCKQEDLFKNILVIFLILNIFGMGVMSIIQDFLGRKWAFLISLTLRLVGSGFCFLAPSLSVFVTVHALSSTQSLASYIIPFVWAQEFVGPEKRTLVNFLMTLVYSVATVSLGVVAYGCHTWIQLGLATTIPFIFLYSYYFLVDESPRWLLSVGRTKEAINIIEKIAISNKTESNLDHIREEAILISEECLREKNANRQSRLTQFLQPLQLFKTRNLRLKVVLLTVIWISNVMVYNSVAFNAPNLGNLYIAFIVQASVEAPACIFNVVLSNRIGRIPPMAMSMLFSAFLSFLCIPAYIGDWNQWYVIIFAALAKFGICISYNILFQATGEFYPTALRGTGIGVNSVTASICLVAMPSILSTADEAKWYPMMILGVITTIAAFCACFLPELMDKAMPQTVAEAEEMSKPGVGQIKIHLKNLVRCCSKVTA